MSLLLNYSKAPLNSYSLTNENLYHMILFIIIDTRGETMLYRRLESGWAVILPGAVVAMLAWKELSWEAWRVIIVLALLATVGMLYHPRLRHYVLLPSCIAFASGLMLIVSHLHLALN